MKNVAFALCASLCLVVPSFVQALAAAPAGNEQGAGGGGKGNSEMKQLVQGCRKQAQSQGLTPQTHEMRQAVLACVTKEKPGMAKMMGCRMDAMDKGMKPKTDEMKSFMKDCMHKSG